MFILCDQNQSGAWDTLFLPKSPIGYPTPEPDLVDTHQTDSVVDSRRRNLSPDSRGYESKPKVRSDPNGLFDGVQYIE
jgi:hypothetical protein